MRWFLHSSRFSFVVVGVLVLMLSGLATLQYRWIAQLSEAERTRLESRLHEATAGFCIDFDREITRAYITFNLGQPHEKQELPGVLHDRLQQWRSNAVWPELVKELYITRLTSTNEVVLLRFDEETQTCNIMPVEEH